MGTMSNDEGRTSCCRQQMSVSFWIDFILHESRQRPQDQRAVLPLSARGVCPVVRCLWKWYQERKGRTGRGDSYAAPQLLELEDKVCLCVCARTHSQTHRAFWPNSLLQMTPQNQFAENSLRHVLTTCYDLQVCSALSVNNCFQDWNSWQFVCHCASCRWCRCLHFLQGSSLTGHLSFLIWSDLNWPLLLSLFEEAAWKKHTLVTWKDCFRGHKKW